MKKKAAYIFLAIYLLGATELSQLLKMPLLLQHYIEHKEVNQSLSLAKFIYMHYVTDDGDKTDESRDQNLPFKSARFHLQNTVTFSTLKFDLPKIIIHAAPSVWPVFSSSSVSNIALGSLFRPPKSVFC